MPEIPDLDSSKPSLSKTRSSTLGTSGAIDSLFSSPQMQTAAIGSRPTPSSAYGNYRNPSPNTLNGNKVQVTGLTPQGRANYQAFARGQDLNRLSSMNAFNPNYMQMYRHVAPTSEEQSTLGVRRRAGETGIAPLMIQPDEQFGESGQSRFPTLEEYERQIAAPNRPGMGVGDYLNFPTAAAFVKGITEPFRGAIGDLTGLSPYDYMGPNMAPAMMAMGIPRAAEDQYEEQGEWLDTVARMYNAGKAPEDRAPLYHNDPLLDYAAKSLQASQLAAETAAIGTGAGAVGAGLGALAPALATAAEGAGALATGARMAQPVLRAANVAATGLQPVQGGSRLGNLGRQAFNETLGNIQPGVVAQATFTGAGQVPGALAQAANPLFATMGANYLWDQASQNAQQAYADTGSLFDAGSAGFTGGANALTLEPTARVGTLVGLARMGEGFASGMQQRDLQALLNRNPNLAQAYSSPDPEVRERARVAAEKALTENAPDYSRYGQAASVLGGLTTPFAGSTYVPDTYQQQKSQAYVQYSDKLYSPEVLNDIFSGNLNPEALSRGYEAAVARFGEGAVPSPRQLISSNLAPMLQAHRTAAGELDPHSTPYFDYIMQDFSSNGPTQNNMAILGAFRQANLAKDPAAMRQAMQQAYNVSEVDSMKNQLVSNGK